MDNKKLSAVILIDLSKAFDSISHSIFLKKLSAIGVSQETVKWFESYLTRRFQKLKSALVHLSLQLSLLPTVYRRGLFCHHCFSAYIQTTFQQ